MTGTTPTESFKEPIQTEPSLTALATAAMRALGAYDEREEIRCKDTLAELFLTEDRQAPLKDPAQRRWVLENKVAPGAYEFMLARTAFFDQVVSEALKRGVPQLVFLGAGYDTRPYRFRDLAGATRIFELDAAPTQNRKREILTSERVPLPPHLVFVPVDFASGDLAQALIQAGFSLQQEALFVWEGVAYYLTPQAIDNTLAAVRLLCRAGGALCFDFATLSKDALSATGVRRLREIMNKEHPAEPTRFGIPQGRLGEFLTSRGYTLIEELGPAEMEQRYLTLQDGASLGKPPSLFSLAHASIDVPPAGA